MYHPLEQPDEIPTRVREDAMGAYLMMFGALAAGLPLPIINLIAAIIYLYVNNNKGRFVKFHALQSLYSQLPTTLLNAGLTFWTIRLFLSGGIFDQGESVGDTFATVGDMYWAYLYVVIAANLLYVIFSLVGAAKARKGKMFYFFFFGKLAYHVAYKVKATDTEDDAPVNKAPI